MLLDQLPLNGKFPTGNKNAQSHTRAHEKYIEMS